MSELTSMINIGREMEKKLISVGIESAEELIDAGAKGAIHNTEYNRLSEDTKKELKEFSDFLKEQEYEYYIIAGR